MENHEEKKALSMLYKEKHGGAFECSKRYLTISVDKRKHQVSRNYEPVICSLFHDCCFPGCHGDEMLGNPWDLVCHGNNVITAMLISQ